MRVSGFKLSPLPSPPQTGGRAGVRGEDKKSLEEKCMRIDQEKCKGCQLCGDYCPVGAIQYFKDESNPKKKKARIDDDDCVECGVCFRA